MLAKYMEFQVNGHPEQALCPAAPTRPAVLSSSILTVASVTFLFAVGFPWQHHNESLVWAVDLQRLGFWESLLPRPVKHVATYRPLGIALAWLTFRLTGGGLWLQQLVNYLITAFAWLLASSSVHDRLAFAWLSFLCGGAFFAGYIYLFHLHGVFYGPLLAFIAWLLVEDERLTCLSGLSVIRLLAIGALAALFHTFALLLLAAFLVGRCIQDLLERKAVSLPGVALAVAAAAGGIVLLTNGGQRGPGNDVLQGFVTSYRLLELSPPLGVISGLLATLTALSIASRRYLYVGFAVLVSVALVMLHLPVLFAWIGLCCLKAMLLRRFALAGLLAACASLPIATGTGSPTYVLFTLMPAIKITLEGFEPSAVMPALQRRLAALAVGALAIGYISIKSEAFAPLEAAVRPLLAEREKTLQLRQMIAWLEANPQVQGTLRLCQPADYPVRSGAERRYRAPTDDFSLSYYLEDRYGPRLVSGPAQLRLCFGGEAIPGASQLHTLPGRRAGRAALQQL